MFMESPLNVFCAVRVNHGMERSESRRVHCIHLWRYVLELVPTFPSIYVQYFNSSKNTEVSSQIPSFLCIMHAAGEKYNNKEHWLFM